MNMGHWILDDQRKVKRVDLMTWARYFQEDNRHVGDTIIGGLRVSTVFLGIDHNFGGRGPPVLWETMVFGDHEMDMDRCAGTWEQADEMHKRMCAKVREALGIDATTEKKR